MTTEEKIYTQLHMDLMLNLRLDTQNRKIKELQDQVAYLLDVIDDIGLKIAG